MHVISSKLSLYKFESRTDLLVSLPFISTLTQSYQSGKYRWKVMRVLPERTTVREFNFVVRISLDKYTPVDK